MEWLIPLLFVATPLGAALAVRFAERRAKDIPPRTLEHRTPAAIETQEDQEALDLAKEADKIIQDLKDKKEREDAEAAKRWSIEFAELSQTPEQKAAIEAYQQQQKIEEATRKEATRRQLMQDQYDAEQRLALAAATSHAIYVRNAPTPTAKVIATYAEKTMVELVGWVRGARVDGNDIWLMEKSGGCIWSGIFERGEVRADLPELAHHEPETFTMKSANGSIFQQYSTPDPRTPEQIVEHARRELMDHLVNAISTPVDLAKPYNSFSPGGHIASTSERIHDGALSTKHITAGKITADRLYMPRNIDSEMMQVEREYNSLAILPITQEVVDRIQELADKMSSLRREKEEQKNHQAKAKLRDTERRLKRLEDSQRRASYYSRPNYGYSYDSWQY